MNIRQYFSVFVIKRVKEGNTMVKSNNKFTQTAIKHYQQERCANLLKI